MFDKGDWMLRRVGNVLTPPVRTRAEMRDAGGMVSPLSLSHIDLAGLAEALDDHDEWTEWWFDTATGTVIPSMDPSVSGIDDEELDSDELVAVDPQPSRAAYEAMVEFAEAVADPRPRDLLQRALEGKGAFRRFRDTLYEFPELGERWREFERLAAELRAIEWLADHGLAEADELVEARRERRRRADAVLAEIAHDGSPRIDRGELPQRWDEIVALVDAGTSVTLTRDGTPWCTITPMRPGEQRRP